MNKRSSGKRRSSSRAELFNPELAAQYFEILRLRELLAKALMQQSRKRSLKRRRGQRRGTGKQKLL
jgi:hypothetical protein